MNYNERDRYERDRDGYQTHRSERYRHPDRDRGERYRFDDYGDSAHGGYGNESYSGTYGNQGDEGAGHRNVANRGMSTYDTSRNYGNMGSYGGAQGFGSSRGGYSSQRRSSDNVSEFDSGHGRRERTGWGRGTDQQRSHGYESDYDSHGQNSGNYHYNQGSNHELYGDYTPRRFRGEDQGHYNFSRDDYRTHSFGSSRGNYMGSGYERTPRSNEYGSTRGDYGSSGQYMGRRFSGNSDTYDMSGYYRADNDYNSYARDRDERRNDW